jgi:c(7)-type cytochrome triheme protein
MTISSEKIRSHPGLAFIAYFLFATFIAYLAGNSSLYAQDADFYIGNAASGHSEKRPAVYFTHEDHSDSYDCLDCHHDYRNGKNVLDEDDLENGESASCASCHTKDASIDLETAYHRLCIRCHRRVNKQEGDTLPLTCQDCHSRRSPAP